MAKNEVDQLLREVQTITESYNKVAESTGEHFNLFSVLQIENDEARAHSRFITQLLNPKGKHGQLPYSKDPIKGYISFPSLELKLGLDARSGNLLLIIVMS